MNNQMPDGNSAAELNNDPFVSEVQQRAQAEARREFYQEVYARLLSGKAVYTCNRNFSLATRMSDKYQEFAV